MTIPRFRGQVYLTLISIEYQMEIQLLQMKSNGVILWILFNLIQLCQNNLLRLPMEMVELPMLGKVKRYHIEK